jgi:ribosome biogenesis GTPase
MFPQLSLKTGEISNFTDRGTHTTVTSVMIKVDSGTYIIDTPGIREIAPFGIMKQDLSHYFIEFSDFNDNCKFNTCTHSHEPGCAISEAVQNGDITDERYDSYLRILETIEEETLH